MQSITKVSKYTVESLTSLVFRRKNGSLKDEYEVIYLDDIQIISFLFVERYYANI